MNSESNSNSSSNYARLTCLTLAAYIAFCLFACIFPVALSLAQPVSEVSTKEKSLIRYSGVVQFVDGSAFRIDETQARTELMHKSVLYEGDTFNVLKNSTLKIISRNECTGIIYGQARGSAENMEKPWVIKADAVRWICAPGANDTIIVRGARLRLEGAEVLLIGRKLLVLRGRVTTPSMLEELPVMKILQAQNGKWKPDDSQSSAYDIWSFNQSRKAPKESLNISQPPLPPPEAKRTRWVFGPAFGSTSLGSDTEGLSRGGLHGDGGHFLTQWRKGKGSLIVMIRDIDFQDHTSESSGGFQGPPPSSISVSPQIVSLEFGYRLVHDRWWSPYFRAGGGHGSMRVNINHYDSVYNYSSETIYDFGILTGAVGVDAYYSPKFINWLGLYASAELDYSQSVYRSARRNLREFSSQGRNPPEAGDAWRLSTFGSEFMFGIMVLI